MLESKPSETLLKSRMIYLRYKKYLKNIPIIILMILDITIYSCLAWNTVKFFTGREGYLRAISNLGSSSLNLQEFWQRNRPQQPIALLVGVIPHLKSGAKVSHDFYARVKNPNSKWLTNFKYRFTAPGYTGEFKEGFILPGEETFILDLAKDLSGAFRITDLEITDIKFRKASDYASRRISQFNFGITDVRFIPGDEINFPKTIFNARNIGASSFWQVRFLIILYGGGQIVGVNSITLDRVLSLMPRNVELNWFEKLPYVSSTEIIPEVNIYDPSVFLDLSLPSPSL